MPHEGGDWITVPGGVTAPAGFLAGAVHCGVKPGSSARKPDLALLVSEVPATAAATFTTNRVKAAPVKVSAVHLKNARARAVLINSGNANACTGLVGIEAAQRSARAVAAALGAQEKEILVCSTGRIGVPLPAERIEEAAPRLVQAAVAGRGASVAAARAIMTSDSFPKELAVRFTVKGKPVTLGGIAKGAGMIRPQMATMLAALATDAAVRKPDLQAALGEAVAHSFNRISVDGDMSTNDTVVLLANGRSGTPTLAAGTPDFRRFQAALNFLCRGFARMIVEDGEGVSKFVEVHVSGAASRNDACRAAEGIANSALVKCSWFGGDPNWGRLMSAVGASGAKVREELVDIYYNGVIAVQGGAASRTPAAKLKEVVAAKKFTVHVNLHLGSAEHVVYTTDLTTQYVKLNMGE